MDYTDNNIRVGSPDLQEIKAYFSHHIKQEDIGIRGTCSDSERRWGNESESEDELDASFKQFLSDAKQKLASKRDCSYVQLSSSSFVHSKSAPEPAEALFLIGTPGLAEMRQHLQCTPQVRGNDSTMITSSPDIEPSFEEFLNAKKQYLVSKKVDIQDSNGIDEKVTVQEASISQEGRQVQGSSIMLVGNRGLTEIRKLLECSPLGPGNDSTMTTSSPDIDVNFETLLNVKKESLISENIDIQEAAAIDQEVTVLDKEEQVKEEQVSQEGGEIQEASILVGAKGMTEIRKFLQRSPEGPGNDDTMTTSNPDIDPSFKELVNVINEKMDIQEAQEIDEEIIVMEEQVSQEEGGEIQEASILVGTSGMAEMSHDHDHQQSRHRPQL